VAQRNGLPFYKSHPTSFLPLVLTLTTKHRPLPKEEATRSKYPLQHHRKARLKWAQEHLEWTVEDWKKVIWSDETKINRLGSDGPGMKWVDTEENGLEKHNVTGTVKFGGGNVMIWGCMTWQGVRYAQISRRQDGYQAIHRHLGPQSG